MRARILPGRWDYDRYAYWLEHERQRKESFARYQRSIRWRVWWWRIKRLLGLA